MVLLLWLTMHLAQFMDLVYKLSYNNLYRLLFDMLVLMIGIEITALSILFSN
jgi:hypothetical protein